MPSSSTSGESRKESTGTKKTIPFDGIFKHIKVSPIKGFKTNNLNVANNIRKKLKIFNKKIHDTVVYGKEMIEKAFKTLNERVGTNKANLLQKDVAKVYADKTTSIITPKFTNQTQSEEVESDSNFTTNHVSSNSNSVDSDVAQQPSEFQVKPSPVEGQVKKKTLNLINSLKTISIIAEKKDTPPQSQKLVGIVS